ncbi:MAG: hypothetical protein FJ244_02805 [Nitrospira sp.]|nr:hypothetical protein [Nitrospira sp.]
MKWIAVILLLCLTSCSTLIVRDDDHAAEATGKVFTRIILGAGTLFWSEVFTQQAKNEEEWVAAARIQATYFGQQCEKEGLTPGTEAYKGCISVKFN